MAGYRVAVFGSSAPVEGEPLYELAREIGAALARAGHLLISGGYGGVMEGASRGAREAGGDTIGVTCRTFPTRTPNAWIVREIPTDDLWQRTRVLVDSADAFVVLAGKAGTLAEIGFLWALDRAGALRGKPILAVGPAWGGLLRYLRDEDWLEPEQLARTVHVTSPQAVVERLAAAATKGNGTT